MRCKTASNALISTGSVHKQSSAPARYFLGHFLQHQCSDTLAIPLQHCCIHKTETRSTCICAALTRSCVVIASSPKEKKPQTPTITHDPACVRFSSVVVDWTKENHVNNFFRRRKNSSLSLPRIRQSWPSGETENTHKCRIGGGGRTEQRKSEREQGSLICKER